MGRAVRASHKNVEEIQSHHLAVLSARGFISTSLIHAVAGVSRSKWHLDLRKYRAMKMPPPLRVNPVTGKDGYFHDEFIAWLKTVTEQTAV